MSCLYILDIFVTQIFTPIIRLYFYFINTDGFLCLFILLTFLYLYEFRRSS